jgi:hypothetical protein
MRNIDAIVRNGTETANSMNDMIKESIKQIEVLCFTFFWFLIFNRNAIEEELEVLSMLITTS